MRLPNMDRHTRECLKRAAECARLAETESDPGLKAYLTKLASSSMQAAGETIKRELEDA
jgi:hypothetical protein